MPKTLLRAVQVILGLSVLSVSVLALIASAVSYPTSGLSGVDPAGVIQELVVGGPAWRDGIREGDRVLELHGSDEIGGWRIVTTDGSIERRSSATSHLEVLRHFVPLSVFGVIVAAIAALLAYRGHRAAAPVLPFAFAVGTQPIFFAGSVIGELFAGAILFVGSAVGVAAFAPWRAWMSIILAVGISLAFLWASSVLLLPNYFDVLDEARLPVAAGYSLVGLVAVVDRRRLQEQALRGGRPGFVDVVYVAVVVGVLAALAAFARVPVEYLAIASLMAGAAYPKWRKNAVSAFERFVTSRARRDAAILAIEDERGRLARDIHDAPLQDLSGVIRRLDAVPGAEREASTLRDVAARLRDFATGLRPPVLEDLGLVAAIEDLRDQFAADYPLWDIVVDIDGVGGIGRPPAEVELAALRVMQQAASNAIAHSGGRRLHFRGSVSADSIDLTCSDNGHGFGEDEAREARRGGHFGIDSMRERADAVGAESVIARGSEGVSVRFHWERLP